MNEATKLLAEGLLKAIQAEQYGNNFYKMAANATEDAKGKEVFLQLAAEEEDHARFLRAHYDSVIETGKTDASAKLGHRNELAEMSPIFSDGLKARIKDAGPEMTSLSIGIQLERDAMKYYRAQSEATDDSEAKKLFAFLSDWEAGHYNALLRQYEELKEDYWSASGFSPF